MSDRRVYEPDEIERALAARDMTPLNASKARSIVAAMRAYDAGSDSPRAMSMLRYMESEAKKITDPAVRRLVGPRIVKLQGMVGVGESSSVLDVDVDDFGLDGVRVSANGRASKAGGDLQQQLTDARRRGLGGTVFYATEAAKYINVANASKADRFHALWMYARAVGFIDKTKRAADLYRMLLGEAQGMYERIDALLPSSSRNLSREEMDVEENAKRARNYIQSAYAIMRAGKMPESQGYTDMDKEAYEVKSPVRRPRPSELPVTVTEIPINLDGSSVIDSFILEDRASININPVSVSKDMSAAGKLLSTGRLKEAESILVKYSGRQEELSLGQKSVYFKAGAQRFWADHKFKIIGAVAIAGAALLARRSR